MPVIRFLMLLSLVIWLGGLIFFAAVVAPSAFAVLPLRQYAGQVVSRTLTALHWIGVGCGIVYLVTSTVQGRAGGAQPLAARHVLIVMMIVLTLVAQFGIAHKMLVLRNEMKTIDEVAINDPRRVEFNRLHHWSTRVEGTVLVLGLVVLYLTARRLS
jgi:uncharacterized membrane protein